MNEDTEEGEHRWYQPAPRRPSPMQDAFKRPTLPYRKRKFEALDSNTTSTDGPLLEDPSSFESAASLRPTALGKGLSDSTTPLPQVMEDPKADNDRPREEGADILPRDVATSDSEELESLFLHLVKTFHSHPPSRENSADTSQYKPSKEGRSYFTPDGRGSSMPPRPSTEPETRVAQEVLDSTPHPLQPMEGSRSQQMTFLAMKLSTASPPYQEGVAYSRVVQELSSQAIWNAQLADCRPIMKNASGPCCTTRTIRHMFCPQTATSMQSTQRGDVTTDYGQDPDDDSFTITMNCAPIVNLPMEHAFVTTIPKTYSHETASNLFVFAELIGVRKRDIALNFQDGNLRVMASRQAHFTQPSVSPASEGSDILTQANYLVNMRLPTWVDDQRMRQVKITFSTGLLELCIPKSVSRVSLHPKGDEEEQTANSPLAASGITAAVGVSGIGAGLLSSSRESAHRRLPSQLTSSPVGRTLNSF